MPIPLQYPEPNDRDRLRCVTLVRIETEDGAIGWGECISQWPDSALAVCTVAEEGLAPLLVGEDARDPRRLWERMRDQTFWYGRGGTASFAISAIDCALWDLAGKLAGQPVHRLLGGAVRDRFRACASIIWDPGDLDWTAASSPATRRAASRRPRAGGAAARDAQFGTDGRRDEACVRAVREAVGPDFGIAADVSGRVRWTARHAIAHGAAPRAVRPHVARGRPAARGLRGLAPACARPRRCRSRPAEREWTVEGYRRRLDSRPWTSCWSTRAGSRASRA